jgi:hypothetical protein
MERIGVCMASFPGAKVHRVSRRKLGRGQHTQLSPVTAVVTDATDTATITLSEPCVINGTIPLNVSGGLTLVSQTVVSATVVQQVYSSALTTKTYSIPAGSPTIVGMQGQSFAGVSGTFT